MERSRWAYQQNGVSVRWGVQCAHMMLRSAFGRLLAARTNVAQRAAVGSRSCINACRARGLPDTRRYNDALSIECRLASIARMVGYRERSAPDSPDVWERGEEPTHGQDRLAPPDEPPRSAARTPRQAGRTPRSPNDARLTPSHYVTGLERDVVALNPGTYRREDRGAQTWTVGAGHHEH
jgi:hypothetical protein